MSHGDIMIYPFRLRLLRLAAGWSAVAFLCGSAAVGAAIQKAVPGADDKVVAYVRAKVYQAPARAPIADATILVQGGRILAVGPSGSIAVLERASGVRVAGPWNSHVHFFKPEWMDAAKQPAASTCWATPRIPPATTMRK
jgi:hypothetical protein